MLRLRRRFAYPAADLVFGNPHVDERISAALRLLSGQRRKAPKTSSLKRCDVAVMGYPRSGNTFLMGWLRYMSEDRLRVFDGRNTHSVLDLARLQKMQVPTFIPARDPIDTVASFMVRANASTDSRFAHDALRSFAIWYRTAGKLLAGGSITVVSFSTLVADLSPLADFLPVRFINPERLKSGNGAAMDWLEKQLRHEEGQGLPLGGVPAVQMISLPRGDRAHLNARAKRTIQAPELSDEVTSAESAFATFISMAKEQSIYL